MKILLVEGRFYEDISNELAGGAIAVIEKAGFQFERLFVPGALEIPAAINFANESGKFVGFVALGCIIRGETYHFEVVSNESARGISDLAMHKNIAIGNGILTVESDDQAWARAATNQGNKGGAAASACIEMIKIKEQFLPENNSRRKN